jgi:hypothetical protein
MSIKVVHISSNSLLEKQGVEISKPQQFSQAAPATNTQTINQQAATLQQKLSTDAAFISFNSSVQNQRSIRTQENIRDYNTAKNLTDSVAEKIKEEEDGSMKAHNSIGSSNVSVSLDS